MDHNNRTLDGKNTFPGIGIIEAITPRIKTKSLQIGKGKFCPNLRTESNEKNNPVHEYEDKTKYPDN